MSYRKVTAIMEVVRVDEASEDIIAVLSVEKLYRIRPRFETTPDEI